MILATNVGFNKSSGTHGIQTKSDVSPKAYTRQAVVFRRHFGDAGGAGVLRFLHSSSMRWSALTTVFATRNFVQHKLQRR